MPSPELTSIAVDLSAGVDVYCDWTDACDSVAKEAADTTTADDGLNSYADLAAGNERRNSEMNIGTYSRTYNSLLRKLSGVFPCGILLGHVSSVLTSLNGNSDCDTTIRSSLGISSWR